MPLSSPRPIPPSRDEFGKPKSVGYYKGLNGFTGDLGETDPETLVEEPDGSRAPSNHRKLQEGEVAISRGFVQGMIEVGNTDDPLRS